MTSYRKKPAIIDAITFDEFVEHGRKVAPESTAAHGGMPWSFHYLGEPITHENDDCYLIPSNTGGTARFERGMMLITGVEGEIYPCPMSVFEATYDLVEAPVETSHIDRIGVELAELRARAAALDNFIQHNPIHMTLDPLDQSLMVAQLGAMMAYEGALVIRYNRAVDALPEPVEPFTESGDYPPSLMDVQPLTDDCPIHAEPVDDCA